MVLFYYIFISNLYWWVLRRYSRKKYHVFRMYTLIGFSDGLSPVLVVFIPWLIALLVIIRYLTGALVIIIYFLDIEQKPVLISSVKTYLCLHRNIHTSSRFYASKEPRWKDKLSEYERTWWNRWGNNQLLGKCCGREFFPNFNFKDPKFRINIFWGSDWYYNTDYKLWIKTSNSNTFDKYLPTSNLEKPGCKVCLRSKINQDEGCHRWVHWGILPGKCVDGVFYPIFLLKNPNFPADKFLGPDWSYSTFPYPANNIWYKKTKKKHCVLL